MANSIINAMTDTWNAAGTTFTAIKMTVTNTASAAASTFLEFLDGATSRFKLGKLGNMTMTGATVTSSTPMIDITQTWNAAGVGFTGLKANFTVTASNNLGKFWDVQRNGASVAWIDEFGALIANVCRAGSTSQTWFSAGSAGASLGSGQYMAWTLGANNALTTVDTAIRRNAAGVLEIDNGVAGTYRDLKVRDIIHVPSATLTPANNGELVVEATANTTLTFKLKGSDGTVRSGTLTLA